jgi:hypothetical protein
MFLKDEMAVMRIWSGDWPIRLQQLVFDGQFQDRV